MKAIRVPAGAAVVADQSSAILSLIAIQPAGSLMRTSVSYLPSRRVSVRLVKSSTRMDDAGPTALSAPAWLSLPRRCRALRQRRRERQLKAGFHVHHDARRPAWVGQAEGVASPRAEAAQPKPHHRQSYLFPPGNHICRRPVSAKPYSILALFVTAGCRICRREERRRP